MSYIRYHGTYGRSYFQRFRFKSQVYFQQKYPFKRASWPRVRSSHCEPSQNRYFGKNDHETIFYLGLFDNISVRCLTPYIFQCDLLSWNKHNRCDIWLEWWHRWISSLLSTFLNWTGRDEIMFVSKFLLWNLICWFWHKKLWHQHCVILLTDWKTPFNTIDNTSITISLAPYDQGSTNQSGEDRSTRWRK